MPSAKFDTLILYSGPVNTEIAIVKVEQNGFNVYSKQNLPLISGTTGDSGESGTGAAGETDTEDDVGETDTEDVGEAAGETGTGT